MTLTADAVILVLRIAVVVILYLFLFSIVALNIRELRAESANRGDGRVRGRLVVVDPGTSSLAPGALFDLEPVSRLGRANDSTVVLEDEFVSAAHALLVNREGRWWVRDTGSTNGTLLNNRPLEREGPLQDGDELQIGSIKFRLVA